MLKYTPNHDWVIIYENNLLLLNAGADNIFAIEDVLPETAEELLNIWKKKIIEPSTLSKPANDIFSQLITANIVKIVGKVKKKQINSISLRYCGSINRNLEASLKNNLKNIIFTKEEEADLLVFVRTNSPLKNIVDETYHKIDTPHLFVDLAYHHIFSIGPLVYPDATACLGCLSGRLSNYWGDAMPPGEPKMSQNFTLVTSLLGRELEKIINDDQSLINKTISYDFDNYEIKINKIYKLPWCPFCKARVALETLGYFVLPWIKRL